MAASQLTWAGVLASVAMLSLLQMELCGRHGWSSREAYGRWIDETPARDGNPDEDCVLRLCHGVRRIKKKRRKRIGMEKEEKGIEMEDEGDDEG